MYCLLQTGHVSLPSSRDGKGIVLPLIVMVGLFVLPTSAAVEFGGKKNPVELNDTACEEDWGARLISTSAEEDMLLLLAMPAQGGTIICGASGGIKGMDGHMGQGMCGLYNGPGGIIMGTSIMGEKFFMG